MKKTLSIVLSLIMIVSTLAIAPFSATALIGGTCGDNLIWKFTNEDTLTVSGTGAMDDYNIATNNLPPWYNYQNNLKVVIIEDGVTNIGNVAFCNSDNLEEVRMSDSVTSIGSCAFSWCGSLKKVVFSNKLQTVGAGSFTGCESLKSVDLPDTLKTIDEAAFNYAGIGTLNVPSSVTTIGTKAFGDIPLVNYYGKAADVDGDNWGAKTINGYIENNLLFKDKSKEYLVAGINYKSSYTIPNTVKVIGDSAFRWNDKIKKIVIPDSVAVIEGWAFDGCTYLESVTWSKKLIRIDEQAFRYCSNLKSLECPSTLVTIGNYAFADCIALGNVGLNYGLKQIGECAFSEIGAKRIFVPCSVAEIGGNAFDGATKLFYNGKATGAAWGAVSLEDNNSTTCHKATTTVTKATTTKNGSKVVKCSNCGRQLSKTTIYYPKTITLSTTKYTYDGNVKKPAVTVKNSNGKTISSSNYDVTYPSGRKLVGKYTVKVAFKGNYTGSLSKSFTIVPKSTTISSLTAASKGFTVKWKKQATQTTGYQIQIATDSKFTKGVKSYTVTKNTTVSKKITNLTGNKMYYVRIRTYKTVSGTKYYSAWSAKKSVTTKK